MGKVERGRWVPTSWQAHDRKEQQNLQYPDGASPFGVPGMTPSLIRQSTGAVTVLSLILWSAVPARAQHRGGGSHGGGHAGGGGHSGGSRSAGGAASARSAPSGPRAAAPMARSYATRTSPRAGAAAVAVPRGANGYGYAAPRG